MWPFCKNARTACCAKYKCKRLVGGGGRSYIFLAVLWKCKNGLLWNEKCKRVLGGEGWSLKQRAVAPEVAASFQITTSNVLPWMVWIITWAVQRWIRLGSGRWQRCNTCDEIDLHSVSDIALIGKLLPSTTEGLSWYFHTIEQFRAFLWQISAVNHKCVEGEISIFSAARTIVLYLLNYHFLKKSRADSQ